MAASLRAVGNPYDYGNSDDDDDDKSPASKRRRPGPGGRRGDGGTDRDGPPAYDARARVRTVLADPHFYYGNVELARMRRWDREAAFGEGTTVGQVFQEYFTSRGKGGGAQRLSQETKASDRNLEAYFAVDPLSLEQLLDRWEVLSLDPSGEVELFFQRRVEGGVATPRAVFEAQAATATTHPRSYRLCYVLGPSGSGKTFFALEHLRTFLTEDRSLPSVAVYLRAGNFEGYASEDAPSTLVDKVKKNFGRQIEWDLKRVWDPSTPLNMHVCLVFDQAGSTASQGFFDSRDKVERLHAELQSANLARTVTLVMCGTSLLPQTFSSDRDAYYFRLRPWTRSDLEQILDRLVGGRADKVLRRDETSTIAEAVSNISLLDALSTNARCAYFMVEDIAEAAKQTSALRQLGWQAHLRAQMPGIVKSVLLEYMADNGLLRLNEDQLRRVSAWVLGGLSQLRPGEVTIPEFPGLGYEETIKAMMLLQLNLQKSGGTVGIADGEAYSVSLTPAVSIVLFSMAGVFTDLVVGWRGDEEVAALFAAKQAILERWSRHEKAFRDMERGFVPGRDSMSTDEFDKALRGLSKRAECNVSGRQLQVQLVKELKEVKICRYQTHILPPGTESVHIPMVSKHSILVNGGRASFADAIAPYTFLQTKHTSTPQERTVDVNLSAEVNKCCLLKKLSTTSDLFLRGLLALWDATLAAGMHLATEGNAGATVNKEEGMEEAEASSPRPVQASRAYPVNLIKRQQESDGITCAEVLPPRGLVKGTKFVLPKRPDSVNITLVLLTNAERLCLTLFKEKSLIITEDSLDGDMQVDASKLPNEDERTLWASFQDTLLPGATIQFLFTWSRN